MDFNIIGVVEKVGREANNGTNARIFIPIGTMRTLFRLKGNSQADALSFMNYQPRTREEHEAAKAEVHQIIAQRHGFDPKLEDAFEDWDTMDNSRKVAKIFDAMDWFLVCSARAWSDKVGSLRQR